MTLLSGEGKTRTADRHETMARMGFDGDGFSPLMSGRPFDGWWLLPGVALGFLCWIGILFSIGGLFGGP